MRSVLALAACFALCLPAIRAQQTSAEQPQLSPRDVFWSASDLVGTVAHNPGSRAEPASPPPAKAHTTPKPRQANAPQQIDPNVVTASGFGAQPALVRASAERLGIRYAILEDNSERGYSEVVPSAAFHSGDRVKISVMTNAAGYLYLIQQGSSGSWSPIFPAADTPRESNKVVPGYVYQLPSGDNAFEFTGAPGKEKLFIVFSRQPIDDLDQLIFGLREPAKSTPAPAAARIYEGHNTISDTLIERLSSRDLTPVKEQVTDSSGGGDQGGEKAVYVVSATSSSAADSRVIARFELNHQ